MNKKTSARDLPLATTPVAVVDFETTGFSPTAGCRVVEVAIARVDPGAKPRVILDSLVNPLGPVHATSIHGISDADVVDAPTFSDLADEIVAATHDAVVASFNASFDMRFWEAEFLRANAATEIQTPPHVCLMYMRPLLGLGKRCDLSTACSEIGLIAGAHQASDDAIASAYLWIAYRDAAIEAGVSTFGDLERFRDYKFLKSLTLAPIGPTTQTGLAITPTTYKARTNPFELRVPEPWPPRLTAAPVTDARPGFVSLWSQAEQRIIQVPIAAKPAPSAESARRIYWHALVDVTEDWQADEGEIAFLADLRERHGLSFGEVRAMHARLLGQRLLELAEDNVVDVTEEQNIYRLGTALAALGWSPLG
jgi:DNA polymerase III epsilon subunit-like protein